MNILTVDTNIWAYYFSRGAPEHKYVEKPIDGIIKSGKEEIAVNSVIVMELAHFLVKSLGPIEAKAKIDLFLSFPMIIGDLDYSSTLDSIEELKKYSHLGIGGRDATILAFMRKASIRRIMTHDAALKQIDWLDVIDPIP